MANEVLLPVDRMRISLRIEVQVDELQSTFGTPQKKFKYVKNGGFPAYFTGRVETLSGRELETAQRLFPNATHRVTVPYLSFLTMRHRFVVQKNEKRLEIGHINNVEMADKMQICFCQEVVAGGLPAESNGCG